MVAEINGSSSNSTTISQLSRAKAAQGSSTLSQETLEAVKNGALPPEIQEAQTSKVPKDDTVADTEKTSTNINQEQTSLEQKLSLINKNNSSSSDVIKNTANVGTLVDIVV